MILQARFHIKHIVPGGAPPGFLGGIPFMKNRFRVFLSIAFLFSFLTLNSDLEAAAASEEISSLVFEGISLDQTFSESVTSYTASVPSDIQTTRVTAVSESNLKVNGVTVNSGSPSQVINLKENGVTEIAITTQSISGMEKTYYVKINRLAVPSVSNPSVNSSGGELLLIWEMPDKRQDLSTVIIARDGVVIGQSAAAERKFKLTDLSPGKTYKFSVTGYNKLGIAGEPLSINYTAEGQSAGDKKLARLSADIPINEQFQPSRTNYSAIVPYTKYETTVYPTAEVGASVRVNGILSGSSITVPLSIGSNSIIVEVISNDSSITKYVINVTRLQEITKSDLLGLSLTDASMNESFMPGRYSYTSTVPYERAEVSLVPIADSSTFIKINGNYAASGSAYKAYLNVGSNYITIETSSSNSVTRKYSVYIYRSNTNRSVPLKGLFVDGVHLDQSFDVARTHYTGTVPFEKDAVKIVSVIDSPGYGFVNNTLVKSGDSVEVSLNVGKNIIRYTLYNGHGQNTTYNIELTRLSSGSKSISSGSGGSSVEAAYILNKDTVELDLGRMIGKSFTLKLDSLKKAASNPNTVKYFLVKVSQTNDFINSIYITKDVANYLKESKIDLSMEMESIKTTIKFKDLPTDAFTFALSRIGTIGSQLPVGAQPVVADFKVEVGKPIEVFIDLDYKLDKDTSKRVVVYENKKLAKTRIAQGKKRFSIVGDCVISGGLLDIRFIDIDKHWALKEIKLLTDRGLVSGYQDNTFRPNHKITRAEFVQILVNSITLQKGNKNIRYRDAPQSAWYFDAVDAASSAGLIKGNSKNEFRPNDLITREEISAIFGRLIDQTEGFSMAESTISSLKAYKDGNKVSPWATEAFDKAIRAGIVSGVNGGMLLPKANGTRAETIVMVYRFIESTYGL